MYQNTENSMMNAHVPIVSTVVNFLPSFHQSLNPLPAQSLNRYIKNVLDCVFPDLSM